MEILVANALSAIKQKVSKTDWLMTNCEWMLEYSIEDMNKAWKTALEKSSALQ